MALTVSGNQTWTTYLPISSPDTDAIESLPTALLTATKPFPSVRRPSESPAVAPSTLATMASGTGSNAPLLRPSDSSGTSSSPRQDMATRTSDLAAANTNSAGRRLVTRPSVAFAVGLLLLRLWI